MSKYSRLFSLQGKVALVTGGTGILGTEFCTGLVEYGADIAIVDIGADSTKALAAELSDRFGVRAIGLACDVSKPASVQHMVDEVVSHLGGIHILLNNAASKSDNLEAYFEPTEHYSLDEWRKIMSVNIDGMFLVAQTVGRHMIQQRMGGSIVQTASIYGIMGPDPRIYEGSLYLGRQINTPAVYSVSKGAVIALTRHLATTWANYGIRVNTLTPGGVESGQNDTFKEKYSQRIPLGRMGFKEEMVGAVVYLSSEASTYVTGQNIVVDGGLSCW